MATFSEDECGALDYAILRDGGISLYLRIGHLEQDAEQLKEAEYQLFRFDCSEWESELNM